MQLQVSSFAHLITISPRLNCLGRLGKYIIFMSPPFLTGGGGGGGRGAGHIASPLPVRMSRPVRTKNGF